MPQLLLLVLDVVCLLEYFGEVLVVVILLAVTFVSVFWALPQLLLIVRVADCFLAWLCEVLAEAFLLDVLELRLAVGVAFD